MWRDRLPVSLTRLVTPHAIRAYAEGLGWQRVEGVNDKIAVYKDPASPLRQLIVPLDEAFDDYGERTAEAIHRLSEFEGRSPQEILDRLLLPPSDILSFREIGAHGDDLLIPLDRATRMINGAREILLSGALSVLTPRPYHPRTSRGEAEDFVSGCRLGLPERDRFVLTVACPLDLKVDLLGPGGEPFTRRVTALLMQSLGDLSRATDAKKIDDLADTVQHPGISANLCEALLQLRPSGERSRFEVLASWSRAFQPNGWESRREIPLRQEVFDVAEVLAARLRSVPAPLVEDRGPQHDVGEGPSTPPFRPQRGPLDGRISSESPLAASPSAAGGGTLEETPDIGHRRVGHGPPMAEAAMTSTSKSVIGERSSLRRRFARAGMVVEIAASLLAGFVIGRHYMAAPVPMGQDTLPKELFVELKPSAAGVAKAGSGANPPRTTLDSEGVYRSDRPIFVKIISPRTGHLSIVTLWEGGGSRVEPVPTPVGSAEAQHYTLKLDLDRDRTRRRVLAVVTPDAEPEEITRLLQRAKESEEKAGETGIESLSVKFRSLLREYHEKSGRWFAVNEIEVGPPLK